jgi:hypothetical protein
VVLNGCPSVISKVPTLVACANFAIPKKRLETKMAVLGAICHKALIQLRTQLIVTADKLKFTNNLTTAGNEALSKRDKSIIQDAKAMRVEHERMAVEA